MPLFRHGNETCLPLITKLTCKAVQVVNVVLGSHHHLKGRDELTTGGAVPRYTKEPGTINIFLKLLQGDLRWWLEKVPAHPAKLSTGNALWCTQARFILGRYISIPLWYILRWPFLMKITSRLRRKGKDKYIRKLT